MPGTWTTRGTGAAAEAIRRAGVAALVRELGPVCMVRFLQQFEAGRGDHTAERRRWEDQEGPSTSEAVVALGGPIRREREAGRLGPVGPRTQGLRP